MNDDTAFQQGRHIDFEGEDEFELVAMTEPANAYGPAWRERFASRHHLHNSIAS
jgi:hypothetical protein